MKNIKKIIFLIIIIAVAISLSACLDDIPTAEGTYNVVYSGNGNTAGETVSDTTDYNSGDTVSVLGNENNLEKDGFVFDGWNSQSDGQGTDFGVGSTFTINGNKILYAKWIAENENEQLDRYAHLKQINLRPVVLQTYGSAMLWNVAEWGQEIKLEKFSFTFGEIGTESPSNILFQTNTPLQQQVFYNDINSLNFINIPVNTFKEFPINSSSNYFNKMVSTTNTLSFRASVFISNFAQPSNPPAIMSIGSTGGSIASIIEHLNVDVPVGATELVVDSFGHTLPVAGLEEFDLQFVFDINRGQIPAEDTYNVTYNGNGTTQNIPNDSTNYSYGNTVTVEEQGNMNYEGYIFTGWNTQANGTGTSYNGNENFIIIEDTTLYAQWTEKATATITSKPFKDAVLSGNTYDENNVIWLTDGVAFGMIEYLYVNYASTQTMSISTIAEYAVVPNNTEDITVVYKKNGVATGYTDIFDVPDNTGSAVAISIEVKQLGINIANTMIYIRKLP